MNRILALLPFPAKACNFACLGEPFNRPWGAFLDFCMGATMAAELATTHRFRLVLIKPSHYDDDGYVIQWWRSSIIQVDTMCHKTANFIEKAKRAGVTRVFIGLENINPTNLLGAKKRQNKITEYRRMLLAWKNVGIVTYAG